MGLALESAVLCNWQIDYPSGSKEGDSIDVEFTTLDNAWVYVIVGEQGKQLSGFNKDKQYFYKNWKGDKYDKKKFTVKYPEVPFLTMKVVNDYADLGIKITLNN